MIQLTIDDRRVTVAEGRTLLEACREHGFPVPTLCYHPALKPYGGCRLCVVEVAQPPPPGDARPRPARLAAACTYPCEPGLVVRTNSEAVQRSRRLTAELLLAGAYQSPEMWALAKSLGVEQVRFQLPEADNCVVCGLCVRACQEIVGVSAISLIKRGMAKQVSPPFEIASAACLGCGTCVLICPTGVLRLEDVSGYRSAHAAGAAEAREYCQTCSELDLEPHFVAAPEALLAAAREGTGL
ncbi:MAG: (2Fe-2S)-binding protein [Anaerolineales bacterium]|nr:(2Fe-2S)-binding protein [Anaerolineales bacterium]